MIIEIIRLEENFKYGTFGIMKIDKQVFCVTLEPPDLLNEKMKSNIPAQQYECRRYRSRKYADTFQVMNVPGRDKILFHSGNIVEHTAGCILLAEHFGKLYENRAVLNSGVTFDEFILRANFKKKLHLTITEHY